MFDAKSQNRHWNITFTDYTSHSLPSEELNSYAFRHISSISSGRVRTLDRLTGNVVWEEDYGSPMIALYVKHGQDILTLPFTSFADSVLDSPISFTDKLRSTLYIGESDHGLYALSSLVDQSVTILPDNIYPNRLLIGGPDPPSKEDTAIILGHYRVNTVSTTQYLITGRSDAIIQQNVTKFNFTRIPRKSDSEMDRTVKTEPWSSESKFLVLIVALLFVVVVSMFWYIMAQVREIKQSSQGSSQGSGGPNGPISVQKGVVTIGKISFDTQDILGKGCEGTFVFRGNFDGRSVAVKRLLPECFTVADREVQLLRESDAHPNVIRYFSTEEDSQFRYIALELCDATLQDFVEKGICQEDVSAVDVLKQAISGLEHLHYLKIVHRDIKPHNILLSVNPLPPKVRVMISDFGLCKKLQNGKVSFSRRSGITGTEGWIAPEMMVSNGRVMCAVDIFSMGCVFYYTMVKGKHPFGEPIRRQSNILSHDFKLSGLGDDELWKTLILKMICQNPLDRPSASTVRKHPVFWERSYALTFLQDVSDRVEKETVEGTVLQRLEEGGEAVCCGDWKQFIDPEVSEDLGKYRSYRGDSIRDLLRALRNKKHHYRELNPIAQEKLGPSAESYITYWLTRFPLLLYHAWSSMQFLRTEPAFAQYYDPVFTFPCHKSNHLPGWFFEKPKPSPSAASQEKTRTPVRSRWKTKAAKKEDESSQNTQGLDKDAWIKAGQISGAWRPSGLRDRRTEKSSDMENLVWKLS
ncbi:hypothetical protein GE061_004781 [Apolygus lucorum]|uniref:non-specific serine/threonine protein kinase n=1 Tax=Apolygus lucorum TaxID=248454 RepID=A0A6A4J5W6_APOLU|nr:hypothetical protein GE061_004781 [Apolygus lucorum]